MTEPTKTQHVDEERVSVLTADRPCASCGYNLVGQSVVREPHYRMLIVRCPECGTIASVQEYPLLGRWANRWASVLAALWFMFLLAAWAGSSGLIFAWTAGVSEESSRHYGRHLRTMHTNQLNASVKARKKLNEGTASPATPGEVVVAPVSPGGLPEIILPPGTELAAGMPPNVSQQIVAQALAAAAVSDDFEVWWRTQDPDQVLARSGGWAMNVHWLTFWLYIPAGITIFALGWFWSIALLRLKRRWVLAWGLMIVGLACVFASFLYFDMMDDTPNWYWQAARKAISPPIIALTLGYAMLPLAAGMLLGRPVTRLMVRALLPPGLRNSLAYLWVAEGLALPGK